MEQLKTHSKIRCFDGWLYNCSHHSASCSSEMRFAIFLPPQAETEPVPALYWLSGLSCTEENFMAKGGAQRLASELGVALIAADTSPRNTGIAGEDDNWDLGSGAGFYVNATQPGWCEHYQMYDYVTQELPVLIETQFAVDPSRKSIFGHSMGGHGALIAALKNPSLYRSVSAFSPICAPSHCPWGEKAFGNYLGADHTAWAAYDATLLVQDHILENTILIDQGNADAFLDQQLNPLAFKAACEVSGQALTLRFHDGYDHSYFFIATFMEDHLRFHANYLLDQR
ncbi:S-formylglutathione hydrolase [hydrothermal vent metagenome]|uniref:S-formylglutathione hydrolase n=1 Tax=hydrothermal vent metagenome TaxID=652676 RepID=A0A3B0ZT24_9ZZZZ